MRSSCRNYEEQNLNPNPLPDPCEVRVSLFCNSLWRGLRSTVRFSALLVCRCKFWFKVTLARRCVKLKWVQVQEDSTETLPSKADLPSHYHYILMPRVRDKKYLLFSFGHQFSSGFLNIATLTLSRLHGLQGPFSFEKMTILELIISCWTITTAQYRDWLRLWRLLKVMQKCQISAKPGTPPNIC